MRKSTGVSNDWSLSKGQRDCQQTLTAAILLLPSVQCCVGSADLKWSVQFTFRQAGQMSEWRGDSPTSHGQIVAPSDGGFSFKLKMGLNFTLSATMCLFICVHAYQNLSFEDVDIFVQCYEDKQPVS